MARANAAKGFVRATGDDHAIEQSPATWLFVAAGLTRRTMLALETTLVFLEFVLTYWLYSLE